MASGTTSATDVVPDGTGAVVETAAEQKVFPPFDATTYPSQLLWLAITFVALYWLMAKVIIPRIGGILADRASRIAADLESAEQAKAKSEAAKAGYEKALADARARGLAIAEEARTAAKASVDKERATTEAGLAAKLADAEKRIAGIKQQAMTEVGTIAGEATQAIVSAFSGTDVSRADVDKAVADALQGGAGNAR